MRLNESDANANDNGCELGKMCEMMRKGSVNQSLQRSSGSQPLKSQNNQRPRRFVDGL